MFIKHLGPLSIARTAVKTLFCKDELAQKLKVCSCSQVCLYLDSSLQHLEEEDRINLLNYY